VQRLADGTPTPSRRPNRLTFTTAIEFVRAAEPADSSGATNGPDVENVHRMQEFFLGTDPNLVLPEPTLGQLREIATRCVVPTFNRLLATFGASIEPDDEAMTMMAEVALETGTYARGSRALSTNSSRSLCSRFGKARSASVSPTSSGT